MKTTTKTTLEIRIEELNAQIPILEAELASCEKEQQKATNFYEIINQAERFAYEYWKKREKENEKRLIQNIKDNKDYYGFNLVEWDLKSSIKSYENMNNALESFREIVKDYEDGKNELEGKLTNVKNELAETERRLLRFQLKKQGKELLKCEYNSKGVLGCLGDRQCKNCIANYHQQIITAELTNHE